MGSVNRRCSRSCSPRVPCQRPPPSRSSTSIPLLSRLLTAPSASGPAHTLLPTRRTLHPAPRAASSPSESPASSLVSRATATIPRATPCKHILSAEVDESTCLVGTGHCLIQIGILKEFL